MGDKIATDLILAGFANLVNGQLAPAYQYSLAYTVGDIVIHGGSIYKCISPVLANTAFDETKWTKTTLAGRFWIGTTAELSTADIEAGTIIITTDDGASVFE